MTDISRRTLLAGGIGALGVAAFGAYATAAPRRTTVIHIPHPDDEAIRLGVYIADYCIPRGDRMVAVSYTSGEATYKRGKLGWSEQKMRQVRADELDESWAVLTHGYDPATIIRLNLPDGGVQSAQAAAVTTALNKVYPGDIEHYTACSGDDYHPDHQAVANGVLAGSQGTVVRWGQYPDRKGITYRAKSDRGVRAIDEHNVGCGSGDPPYDQPTGSICRLALDYRRSVVKRP